jgi:hypothetical protein
MRLLLALLVILMASCGVLLSLRADEQQRLRVGLQPDGRVLVPTNQMLRPAGKQVTFPGRPVDLALANDGQTLIVKNMKSLLFIDLATAKVRQTLDLPDDPLVPFNPLALMKKPVNPSGKGHHYPTGFSVVGLLVQGDRVFATDSRNHLHTARRQQDGSYQWTTPIALLPPRVGGDVFPTGIARLADDELWVCSSRGNSVQLVNLATGQAEQVVPVGVAPYTIVGIGPERAYVSNWGGDPPREGASSRRSARASSGQGRASSSWRTTRSSASIMSMAIAASAR